MLKLLPKLKEPRLGVIWRVEPVTLKFIEKKLLCEPSACCEFLPSNMRSSDWKREGKKQETQRGKLDEEMAKKVTWAMTAATSS